MSSRTVIWIMYFHLCALAKLVYNCVGVFLKEQSGFTFSSGRLKYRVKSVAKKLHRYGKTQYHWVHTMHACASIHKGMIIHTGNVHINSDQHAEIWAFQGRFKTTMIQKSPQNGLKTTIHLMVVMEASEV